jgi:type IV pilus assembly protein PilV
MLNAPPAGRRWHRIARLRAATQNGASLIEVMVAVVVLSIGMLSMAWQHSVALKYDKMSQFRGVASQLSSELADRIRANAAASASYVYTQAYNPGIAALAARDCTIDICSGIEMAAFDLAEFRNAARLGLPDGGLLVTQDPADPGALTIWLLWRDPDSLDTATATASLATGCPAAVGAAAPMPQCMPLRVLL